MKPVTSVRLMEPKGKLEAGRKPGRPPARGPRVRREKRTLEVMIGLYCRDHHGGGAQLCERCADLLTYAHRRLDHCPFGESKYACVDCRIRCYNDEMVTATRQVMRYAGPRIWWRHPVLAFFHFLNGRRLHRSPHDQPAVEPGAPPKTPGRR